ncbi:MAG: hypothetical protein DRJ51_08905 [Thermoprotei archaeon]|nr:MAG: hypothetical protein DRJ51_08905 [Thermoprotei archaeon]
MSGVEWPKGRVFPKFSKPDSLRVVDLRGMDFFNDLKYLPLITLQGLVNREKPRIYVILTDRDEKWLELIQQEGITTINTSLEEVMAEYAKYSNGYIVYDSKVPDTLNVANTMSGIYNSIVVNPKDIDWIEGLGLKLFEDLRGRFKSKIDAYRWAYEELWPRCDHRLLVPMRPEPLVRPSKPKQPMQIAVRDYVTALRLFAHDLNPYDSEELALFRKLLEDMPDNAALLGWYFGTEHISVRLASEYNKFVVVMTGNSYLVSNLTVWSGIEVETKFKLPPIDFSKLGQDKVYVTFYMNDGDNVQWDILMRDFWEDPYRGKVPMAWTISPFLIDLAPLIMKYYAESMSNQDTFVSGPSGAGYWYPNVNPNYVKKFLELAGKYFERTGLRFTEILGEFLDGVSLIHYAEDLNLLAIKLGYRGMDIFPYHLDSSPTPIIPGTIEFSEGEEEGAFGWLKAIATVYKKRPLHVLVICVPWSFKGLKSMFSLAEKVLKDDDFMLVNFHEFVAMLNPEYGVKLSKRLLEKAKEKGVPDDLLLEAKSNLRNAEEHCKQKEWDKALLEVNKIFKTLGPYIEKECFSVEDDEI